MCFVEPHLEQHSQRFQRLLKYAQKDTTIIRIVVRCIYKLITHVQTVFLINVTHVSINSIIRWLTMGKSLSDGTLYRMKNNDMNNSKIVALPALTILATHCSNEVFITTSYQVIISTKLQTLTSPLPHATSYSYSMESLT